jgi:hypothetical protein
MSAIAIQSSGSGAGTLSIAAPITATNRTLTLPDNTGTLVSTGSVGVVTPTMTQVGALPSMVRLNTDNGFGSTNTAIRRYTTTVTNQGSDITYADSATLGATFTINTNGVYAISMGFATGTAGAQFGVSLNSTQLTTAFASIAIADQLCEATVAANGYVSTAATCLYLPSGSVIRAHGPAGGTSAGNSMFTITRVA